MTAEGHQYDDDDELYELYGPDIEIHRVVQFWESIRTNNISSQDRRNVKRYEDERCHRNAVITSKIIHLGVCIAMAWARDEPFRPSKKIRHLDNEQYFDNVMCRGASEAPPL